jgi:DNA-binding NtrC family response regulator
VRTLRSEVRAGSDLPAIAISGDLRAAESSDLMGAGFAAFFPKPLDLDRMVGTLTSLLPMTHSR